jgi:hypothetical protein
MIDSKGHGFGCFGLGKGREWLHRKRKAGASSRSPNAVSYEVNYAKQ